MLNHELKQKLKELLDKFELCESGSLDRLMELSNLQKKLCNELFQSQSDTLDYQQVIYFKLCMIDISPEYNPDLTLYRATWIPSITKIILESCLEICERHAKN